MIVEIRGTDLPGRRFGDYENVHVGVQRKASRRRVQATQASGVQATQAGVVDLVPGDADEATWTVEVTVKRGPDFAGPYVHGDKGDRFLYLSWGTVGASGEFTMFRRAKLMLRAVDPSLIDPDGRLVCALGLTGGDGGPRCAAVRPPNARWFVSDR